jgi:hypothetical protein
MLRRLLVGHCSKFSGPQWLSHFLVAITCAMCLVLNAQCDYRSDDSSLDDVPVL